MLSRLLADGIGQFGGPVVAAELYSFAEAFGKLDARRATSDVSFDLLAGVWRQFQIQIAGE